MKHRKATQEDLNESMDPEERRRCRETVQTDSQRIQHQIQKDDLKEALGGSLRPLTANDFNITMTT